MEEAMIQGIMIGTGLTLAIVATPLFIWLWFLANARTKPSTATEYWCHSCEIFVNPKNVTPDSRHNDCGMSVTRII